ncbi:ComF family protein [Myxococcota bacterium]|nr:ComF family protein [Myxococcota bacterium]
MLRSLLPALFLPCCPGCLKNHSGNRIFCTPCAARVELLQPPFCPRCGYPYSHGLDCPHCTLEPPPWQCAVSIFPYSGPVASAIRLGKYGNHPWIFSRLGELMAHIAREFSPRYILPVPTARSRWLKRGFNPAAILAREIACRMYNSPVSLLGNHVIRTDDHKPQAAKSKKERSTLPSDTFVLRRTLPAGGPILLVDDVMTTGATLKALSLSLATDVPVFALTLARTL